MGCASAACFQITVQNHGITAQLCHALNWRAWLFPCDDKRRVRISARFLFSFKSFTFGHDLPRSGCCFSSPLHAAQRAVQCRCSCCRYPSGWLARGSCTALLCAAARPPVGVRPASSCTAARRHIARSLSHCAARARSLTSLLTHPAGTAAQLATRSGCFCSPPSVGPRQLHLHSAAAEHRSWEPGAELHRAASLLLSSSKSVHVHSSSSVWPAVCSAIPRAR